MEQIKDIVIIGAGGFGREVACLIEDINKKKNKYRLLGFIDDDLNKKDMIINDYKVLGGLEFFKNKENLYFTCAVGNSEIKKQLIDKVINFGGIPETLIHPSVIQGNFIELGKGIIVCAGTIITTNIKIKDYVTINLACTIGHDVIIEEYCTLYPSVNISGSCIIGKLSEVGTKTAIIQGIKLGERTITGAGSIVIRDIIGACTVVGVPAKYIV